MPATLARPDFNDTRLAFRAKSDAQLRWTWLIFRLIHNPWLTRLGSQFLNFGLRLGLPVKGIIRRTLFEVFCGGETLEDTRQASLALDGFGVKTILDYSVEGEKSEAGFDQTCEEILRGLRHAGERPEVCFCACKLTGLASVELMEKIQQGQPLTPEEQAAELRVRQRLQRLAAAAVEQRTPLFIDAEESWIQDAIDAWAEALMEQFNREHAHVYTTVQLYRRDRLDYLTRLIARAGEKGYHLGVKLVRGAYIEKESARAEALGYPNPMQPAKASTDRDFDAALAACIAHIDRVSVCAGTHNERSSLYLTELMAAKQLPPNHPNIWFSQLLGMSDHISFNLAYHGYNVAKYLPYGPVAAVFPYLTRRAQENTSIAGQTSRELELLSRELKRRG
jgi:proline dehydrogenase